VPINFKIEKKDIGKPKKCFSDYVKNNVWTKEKELLFLKYFLYY